MAASILIVEDELLLAKDLADCLTDIGHEVTENASSGEEALQTVEGSKPDLILMDIHLSGELDGIETAERIRTRFDIPIVYLSGYTEKDVLERAKKTEPYGFLGKPVSVLELRGVIDMALHKHKADKRVKESEAMFRAVFENAPVMIDAFSSDGSLLLWNRELERRLGWTKAEAEADEVLARCYPDPAIYEKVRENLKRADGLFHEYTPEAKDGSLRTQLWANFRLPNEDIISIGIDITDRQLVEKAMLDHLSTVQDLVDKAADGFAVCHNIPEEPYVRFTHWNRRMEVITGYAIDEINRLGWYQTVYPDPDIRRKAVERMDRMRTGDNLHAEEWAITTKDGVKKPLSISTSVIKEESGKVHVLAIMRDMTKRASAEKAQQRTE